MVRLTPDKIIKRETAALERTRAITVTLFPHYAGVSIKGTREFYPVPYGAILDLGRKIDAREKMAQRLERRRA
jgi:hypothetical protein